MIGLAEVGDPDQLTVGAIAPAMIRAGEDGRATLVIAAQLHGSVPARIKEDPALSRQVAAKDHRLLAHRGNEEIAGAGDLALMPDEKPRSGKDPLQLFPVDLVIDKDLAADMPCRRIDEPLAIAQSLCGRHQRPPVPDETRRGSPVW